MTDNRRRGRPGQGDQATARRRAAGARDGDAGGGSLVAGRRAVLELLRAGRSAERVYIAQGLAPSQLLGEIRRRAEDASVPVRSVPKPELDRLAGGLHHQGVVARTGRYRYAPLEDLLGLEMPCLLFLDGVMDPHNLGSLLRTAAVAGFDGAVVPARRAAGVTDAARRVAQGAAELLPVSRVANLSGALRSARDAGAWTVGFDERAESSLWESRLLEPPVGIVLGAEDRGLSRLVRESCDELVHIPSRRFSSLNVAVAGAVAMFEVARRRHASAPR